MKSLKLDSLPENDFLKSQRLMIVGPGNNKSEILLLENKQTKSALQNIFRGTKNPSLVSRSLYRKTRAINSMFKVRN